LKSKAWPYLVAIGAIVVVCSAVAVFLVRDGQQLPFQSSITRDSITIEIVETAPAGLDNPNIRNTPDVWRELAENATQSMDIEIYTIYRYSYGPIYDFHQAIYKAAARGVRVRMLIDNEIFQYTDPETGQQPTRELMDEFDANENIEVRQLSEPMHSKVIIVDNKMAYVGSANQSTTAMDSNREVGLVIHGDVVTMGLEAIFEAGWSENENQPYAMGLWPVDWLRLVATPIKTPNWVPTTEETIVSLINSAQKTVHAFVYVFSGSPYTLSSAVEDAANRGVNVQIIVDVGYRDYGVLDMLTENPNIQIKTVDLGGYSAEHAKTVIVDGQKAYVGSANWTQMSMRERREIGIVFEDQTLASALETVFGTDWGSRYAIWVKEPGSFMIFYVAIVVVVGVAIAVTIVLLRRGARKKFKKILRAEFWASGRGET